MSSTSCLRNKYLQSSVLSYILDTSVYILLLVFFFGFFWDSVSLCCSGSPGAHYVAQSSLNSGPPTSVSRGDVIIDIPGSQCTLIEILNSILNEMMQKSNLIFFQRQNNSTTSWITEICLPKLKHHCYYIQWFILYK
jgi:hypothetical protein